MRMKVLRIAVLAIILGLIPCKAEEIIPTEQTKGCIFRHYSPSGNCVFIYFVKVADSDNESENGEPQIWGYNPEDIQKDKNNNPYYVQELSKDFIKAGWVSGRCHCPNW